MKPIAERLNCVNLIKTFFRSRFTPYVLLWSAAWGILIVTVGCSTGSARVEPKQVIQADISARPYSGAVFSSAIGVNVAAWDANLTSLASVKTLRSLDPILRFPGGSFADKYHWKQNSVNPGPGKSYVSYGEFTTLLNELSVPALLTVNYGSNALATGGGTAQSAAKLVDYVQHRTQEPLFWEIGNESYGSWETNLYPPTHDAVQYVRKAKLFVAKLHHAVPGSKVGVPFVGLDQMKQFPNWDKSILSGLGPQLQFVDLHWYPFTGTLPTSTQLMHSVEQIPAQAHYALTSIHHYNPSLSLMVGETGILSNVKNGPPVQAIDGPFAAADVLSWLESGASSVLWWDWHNDGSKQSDYGVVSSGTNGEPSPNVPFPSYWGLWLAHQLIDSGGSFLSVEYPNPVGQVYIFAFEGVGKSIRVLIAGNERTPVTIHLRFSSRVTTRTVTKALLYDQNSRSGPIPVQIPAAAAGGTLSLNLPGGPVVELIALK